MTFSAVNNQASTLTISFKFIHDCLFPKLSELNVSKDVAVIRVDSSIEFPCRSRNLFAKGQPHRRIQDECFHVLVNSILRLVKPVANCLNYMVYCFKENLLLMIFCCCMKISCRLIIIKALRSTSLSQNGRIRDTKADLLLHNMAIERREPIIISQRMNNFYSQSNYLLSFSGSECLLLQCLTKIIAVSQD